MKQIYFLMVMLTLAAFSGCDKKTALEKAVPWNVDGITPEYHTVDFPGYSGIEYTVYVVEEGEGPLLSHGQYVCYRFNAFNEDMHAFDTTIDAEPYCYTMDTGSLPLIGLEHGMMLMRMGAKYRFVFPSSIAYGDQYVYSGLVGPGEDVIYDVEITSVSD